MILQCKFSVCVHDMNTDFGSNRQMPTCKSYEICTRLSCLCQRAPSESTFWPPFGVPFLVVVTTIDIQTNIRAHTHMYAQAHIRTYSQNKWKRKLPRLLLVINGHWFVRLWNSVHGANNKSSSIITSEWEKKIEATTSSARKTLKTKKGEGSEGNVTVGAQEK